MADIERFLADNFWKNYPNGYYYITDIDSAPNRRIRVAKVTRNVGKEIIEDVEYSKDAERRIKSQYPSCFTYITLRNL